MHTSENVTKLMANLVTSYEAIPSWSACDWSEKMEPFI